MQVVIKLGTVYRQSNQKTGFLGSGDKKWKLGHLSLVKEEGELETWKPRYYLLVYSNDLFASPKYSIPLESVAHQLRVGNCTSDRPLKPEPIENPIEQRKRSLKKSSTRYLSSDQQQQQPNNTNGFSFKEIGSSFSPTASNFSLSMLRRRMSMISGTGTVLNNLVDSNAAMSPQQNQGGLNLVNSATRQSSIVGNRCSSNNSTGSTISENSTSDSFTSNQSSAAAVEKGTDKLQINSSLSSLDGVTVTLPGNPNQMISFPNVTDNNRTGGDQTKKSSAKGVDEVSKTIYLLVPDTIEFVHWRIILAAKLDEIGLLPPVRQQSFDPRNGVILDNNKEDIEGGSSSVGSAVDKSVEVKKETRIRKKDDQNQSLDDLTRTVKSNWEWYWNETC